MSTPSTPTAGLIADIYRHGSADYSNGGISSRAQRVTVVGEGIDKVFSVRPDAPAVKLVHRTFGSRTIVHAEPVESPPEGHVGWMAGGTYIVGDSRVGRAAGIYGAISLHDRSERFPQ